MAPSRSRQQSHAPISRSASDSHLSTPVNIGSQLEVSPATDAVEMPNGNANISDAEQSHMHTSRKSRVRTMSHPHVTFADQSHPAEESSEELERHDGLEERCASDANDENEETVVWTT